MKKLLLIFVSFIFLTGTAFCQPQKTITIIDFQTSNVSEQERNLIVDLLNTTINRFDNITVIERDMRESALDGTSYTNQECTDDTCAIEIARLISADEVITGSLGSVGSRYILTMKLIDVANIEIVKDTSGIFDSLDDLVDNCNLLAGELLNQNQTQASASDSLRAADTSSTYVKRYFWGEGDEKVQLTKLMYNRAKRNQYTRIGMWSCYSLGIACTAADIGILLLAGGSLTDLNEFEMVLMSYGIMYGLLGYIGGAVLQWGLEEIYDIEGNLTDF